MIDGVRQFKLINALGAEYDCTRPDALLHQPDGLGWGTEAQVQRLGLTYIGIDEKETHQTPSGEMVFRTYEEYGRFLSFCQQGGLVLCYKPLDTWYYCKCLISIQKSEIQWQNNHLICPVQFTLLSYWYEKVVAQTAEPPEPAEPTYETVTGDPAEFTASYPYPIENLEIDIQGTQDLNGYDKPWVGGRGKNLANPENKNTARFAVDNNGVFTQNTPTSASWAWAYAESLITATLDAGTYYVSFFAETLSTGNSAQMRAFSSANVLLATTPTRQITETGGFSITLTEQTTVGIVAKMYDGAWKFQIEKGSTATSYEPYENICPITAYDTVTVTQTGSTTNTYEVELTGAGNVYKGTLNVTTGELVVEHILWKLTTAHGIASYGNNYRFSFTYPAGKAPNYVGATTFGLSSCFEVSYQGTISGIANATTIVGIPHSSAYFITMPSFTNVTSLVGMNEWLRENKPEVVYELATPLTYHLTPTQMYNLIGSNTIQADSGAVTVTYRADGPIVYKQYPYQYSYHYGDTAQNTFDITCDLPSYFKLTIFGEATNPVYRVVQNGSVVKSGKILATVGSSQKLVINTNPKETEIALYTLTGTRINNLYGYSDFSTERIFALPQGECTVQVLTEDEAQPKVMIEVLKHV